MFQEFGAAAVETQLPSLFRYDPPISRQHLAAWQLELERHVPVTEKLSRLVIRWEPGDIWQPIQRWLLWQCVDPKHIAIEPWNFAALKGPNPRWTGHYCAEGLCICLEKKNRWVGGATKLIDNATWQLYRETGLYGQRWWTLQGDKGGHRFAWAPDELAPSIAQMKGAPTQTPAPGELPYAGFDQRVVRAIQGERRASAIEAALKSLGAKKHALSQEDQAQADALAKAVWDWTGDRVDEIWDEGGELLPRYLEEQYGRAPTGTTNAIDYEDVERRFLTTQ